VNTRLLFRPSTEQTCALNRPSAARLPEKQVFSSRSAVARAPRSALSPIDRSTRAFSCQAQQERTVSGCAMLVMMELRSGRSSAFGRFVPKALVLLGDLDTFSLEKSCRDSRPECKSMGCLNYSARQTTAKVTFRKSQTNTGDVNGAGQKRQAQDVEDRYKKNNFPIIRTFNARSVLQTFIFTLCSA